MTDSLRPQHLKIYSIFEREVLKISPGIDRQKHLDGLRAADLAPVCENALFCTECRRHSWPGFPLRELSTSARATLEARHYTSLRGAAEAAGNLFIGKLRTGEWAL